MDNQILQAFKERSFLYLWIGEIFTQIAINFFNFFLILLVYHLTQSSTVVSGVVITFTLPAVIFGLIAGVYIDRWNKKKVLFISNIVRAILLLILAFSYTNIVTVFVLSFFISIATQFFIPAETPIIPLIVKEKLLFSANALFGIGLYGSVFVAYVISGPTVVLLGYRNTIFMLSLFLIIGAIIISFIKIPRNFKQKEKELHLSIDHLAHVKHTQTKSVSRAVLHDVKQMLSFVLRVKEITSCIFLLALSQVLILLIAVIAPSYAKQILGVNFEEFSHLFIIPAALGVVLGAFLLGSVFHTIKKEKLVIGGLLISGIAMSLLPITSVIDSKNLLSAINAIVPFIAITNLYILFILATILGFANAMIFIPANTILQERTNDSFRGKIYGLLNMVVGVFSFLPIIIVGGLADVIGVRPVIYGVGLIVFIIGIIYLLIEISGTMKREERKKV